ncbi:MAG: DUF4153 domain-containing protein [Erythrobacter sp.]
MTGHQAADSEAGLQDWPLRPWLCAGLLGIAGLLLHFTGDGWAEVPWRMALSAALVFGPLAACFTLDQQRLGAPLAFSGAVALVMAGIAWRATSAGDRYADEEFWVAAGILAVTLSVPLFQAGFHRLRWLTPYKTTHFHVWTDAISGAGALAFTGIAWALLALLSELFAVIKIDLLKDLIDEEWFALTFSGAACGAALGVLRNQLKIIGTLQNVVLLVLSILAVPLALALLVFLAAVATSGIDVLWEATRSATPLLLAIAVGCFVLTNAVVRDEDEQASQSRVLRLAGFVLALGILPLAIMAAISMGTRIDQHGLSPERLWALIAIAVAVAYGVGYFAAALRGRREGWRGFVRQANLHLAVLTCGIAFILALPVFNFGAISASNQLARLESGAVSAQDFDYAALRWDFGDAGRKALAKLAKDENPEVAKLAAEAQAQEQPSYRGFGPSTPSQRLANLRLQIADQALREQVTERVRIETWRCELPCVAIELGRNAAGQQRVAMVQGEMVEELVFDPEGAPPAPSIPPASPPAVTRESKVELRSWTGRRIYVDGEPVGQPFE